MTLTKTQFCSCLSYPTDGLKSLIPQLTESLPAILLMTQNVETRNVFLPSNSVIYSAYICSTTHMVIKPLFFERSFGLPWWLRW